MNWLICYAMASVMPSIPGMKGVAETGSRAFLTKFNREASFLTRLALMGSTLFFVLSPLFTVYIPLPVFFLPKTLRERHIQRAAVHGFYPLRQAMMMVKMVAGLCWGQDPEVRVFLGAPPLDGDPGTFRGSA